MPQVELSLQDVDSFTGQAICSLTEIQGKCGRCSIGKPIWNSYIYGSSDGSMYTCSTITNSEFSYPECMECLACNCEDMMEQMYANGYKRSSRM